MTQHDLVKALYQSVDDRNIDQLATFLDDQLSFRIGNMEPITGKEAVLAANQAFFESIQGMQHQLENIWAQAEHLICHGDVHYTRLDGSQLSLPFATILKLHNNLITDYRVYVDVSPL